MEFQTKIIEKKKNPRARAAFVGIFLLAASQLLGGVFKELYEQRVPFKEVDNAGWRTFLFEPVTEKEWEDRMIENGYR